MSDTTLLEALKRVREEATKHRNGERADCGTTPLIAAMRCYVAYKLGDTSGCLLAIIDSN